MVVVFVVLAAPVSGALIVETETYPKPTIKGTVTTTDNSPPPENQSIWVSTQGDWDFISHTTTSTDGRFRATVPPGHKYSVYYFQTDFPRDGYPDIQLLYNTSTIHWWTVLGLGSELTTLGESTLQEAHHINIRVLTDSGEPVTDAHIGVIIDSVYWGGETDSEGYLTFPTTSNRGFEAMDARIEVHPPIGIQYPDEQISRTVDPSENRTYTFTIREREGRLAALQEIAGGDGRMQFQDVLQAIEAYNQNRKIAGQNITMGLVLRVIEMYNDQTPIPQTEVGGST